MPRSKKTTATNKTAMKKSTSRKTTSRRKTEDRRTFNPEDVFWTKVVNGFKNLLSPTFKK